MTNILKATEIDGWMHPLELGWLAQQAQNHKIIVEIGSFLGRSTRALADNTSGRVYAVDDWYGPRDPHVNITDEARALLFQQFVRNMSGLEGCLSVVKADHGDEKSLDIPERPDMVFIDGGHDYDSVSRDIKYWRKKAAPGALICGHDYDHGFPGVQKAVQEAFPNDFGLAVGSIWFHTKSYPFDSAKGN